MVDEDAAGSGGPASRIQKLDVDNHDTWSFEMEMHLTRLGLWPAVLDTPASGLKDGRARAEIVLHCEQHHHPLLRSVSTAKETWEALEELYQDQGMAGKMRLLDQLRTMRKGVGESITKYFSRARALQAKLDSVSEPVSDSQVVLSVFKGLPPDYEAEEVHVMNQKSELSLREVQSVLLRGEQRLLARAEVGRLVPEFERALAATAPVATRPWVDKRVCYYCSGTGHIASRCPKKHADRAADPAARAGGAHFAGAAMVGAATRWADPNGQAPDEDEDVEYSVNGEMYYKGEKCIKFGE